jgi:excisionase family DNA binding protein
LARWVDPASGISHDVVVDDNPDGFVSVNEAARRMGRSIEQVRRYLREGRLNGRRIGNQWFIEAAAIEAWRPARETTRRGPTRAAEGPLVAAHAASAPSESVVADSEARPAEERAAEAAEAAATAEERAEAAEARAGAAEVRADAAEARAEAAEAQLSAAEAAATRAAEEAAAAAEAEAAEEEARKRKPLIGEELWAELDALREEVRKQGGEFDIVAMLRQAREQG